MPGYTRYDRTIFQDVPDDEKARLKFQNDAEVKDGVVKWKMGNFVPEDIMKQWHRMGLPFDLAKSKAARAADTQQFIAEYAKRDQRRKVSPEEAFEMRAAFGLGKRVVNIMSGRKHRT